MSARKSKLSMMALEPRIMFDGAGAADLAGNTNWTAILRGETFDYSGDDQASKSGTDLVGNVDHAVMYTNWDNNDTTSDTSDDKLSFRLRIGNPTTTFGAVGIVGIDADGDGDLDVYVGVDGTGNVDAIKIWNPGSGLNVSPDTASLSALGKNLTLPSGNKGGVYDFTSTNFQYTAVSSTSDSEWNGVSDIGNDGANDYFISFEISFADLASVLSSQQGITQTKSSDLRYVAITSTQVNNFNGDIGGVNGSMSSTTPFFDLGAYTETMTAETPKEAAAGGTPYVANPIPDQTHDGAGNWSYAFAANTFTDPDNDTMTYTVNYVDVDNKTLGSLPSWVTFDSATRTFSGNPPETTDPNQPDYYYFRVVASDGNTTGQDMFQLKVTDSNDAPTVSNFSVSTNEDIPLTLTTAKFTGAYSDADSGDALTQIQITVLPNAGAGKLQLNGVDVSLNAVITKAQLDAGQLKFVPVANASTDTTFQWKAYDGTAYSAAASVGTIVVNPVNDAPTSAGSIVNATEDTTYTFTLANFDTPYADLESDAIVQIQVTALPTGGTLYLSGVAVSANDIILATNIANLTYVPNANANGNDTFTWKGHDGTAYSTAAGTMTIAVSAVNDAPVLDNTQSPVLATINEDTTASTGDTVASIVVDSSITDADVTAPEAIAITALDSTNGTWQYKLSSGSWADVGAVSEGSALLLGAADSVRFVPAADYSGTATFTFRAWDKTTGTAGTKVDTTTNGGATAFSTATDTASITITAVNDAPTVSNISTATNEDTTLILATSLFTGGYSDLENSTLTAVKITVLPNALHGKLQLNNVDLNVNSSVLIASLDNNELTFVPTANYNGDATFSWQAADGTVYSTGTATATITVNPVNDAPTIATMAKSGTEDTTTTFAKTDFTAVFSDIESDNLTKIQITGLASSGTLKLNGVTVSLNDEISVADLGGLTYTPNANLQGSNVDSFTWKAHDGTDYSVASGMVNISLTNVNDAPVINNLNSDTLTYAAGGGDTLLDQSTAATITDIDSSVTPDFNTGTLTISIASGKVTTEDVLAIKTGAGVTLSGTLGSGTINVTVDSVIIGTVAASTAGISGSDLVVTLNTNATAARIATLVQNITYKNTDTTTPDVTARTVRFALTDGDGGTSGNADVTVNFASTLAIAATSADKAEGDSGTTAYTFTVTRAINTAGATTVDYAITGSGTNVANAADFGGTLPSGTVSFAANETSKVITVNVSGDTSAELHEGFTVTLSNGSGSADITTATATGTIQNDDQSNSVNVHDGALQLDGTNDYVDMGTLTGMNTGKITMEAWVNLNDTGGDQMIFHLGTDPTTNANALRMAIDSLGRLHLNSFQANASTVDSINSTESITWGVWTHVAVVTDGTTNGAAIYFNGVAQTPESSDDTVTSLTTVDRTYSRIGVGLNNGIDLSGMIDEARIWSDARTAAEILANYNQQLNGDEAGLHTYYRFDDDANSTIIRDHSSNEFNGNMIGGAAIVNTLGKAISFNGTSDYLDMGTVTELSGAVTVEAWVYMDAITSSNQRIINLGSASNGYNDAILLQVQAVTGYVAFYTADGSANLDYITTTTAITAGQWVHVAAVTDTSGVAAIYFNGVKQDTGGDTTVTGATAVDRGVSYLGIGYNTTLNPFGGKLDNVRLWNDARTAAEINDNYNQTLTGTHTGLVVNYPFDEIVSTKVDDDAGTNSQGTVVGAVVVNTAPTVYGNKMWIEANETASGYMTGADVTGTPVYSVKTDASNGGVVIDTSSGSWTYTPTNNWTGIDTFTISVYGTDNTIIDSETITVDVGSNTVVLPGGAQTTFTGGSQDQAGYSISDAGDVDGDGIDDVIIGADLSNRSYVVFGSAIRTQTTIDLSQLSTTEYGFTMTGGTSGRLGFTVSGAGDVDGDGLDDVILGDRIADVGGTNRGSAYVVYGKAMTAGGSLNVATSMGTSGFTIYGGADTDLLGNDVDSAGDVNGDGLDDIIVSAAGYGTNVGRSYVIFGKTDTNDIDVGTGTFAGGYMITGIADSYGGNAVSGAGDVDGDGLDDLIIGAYQSDAGATNAGAAFVLFGKYVIDGGSITLNAANTYDQGFAIVGGAASDNLGDSISAAGDVNGDGLADLVVGANSADPEGRALAGTAYVVFGKADTATVNVSNDAVTSTGGAAIDGYAIQGAVTTGYLGGAISGAGDVNGDGLDDVVVGARNTDGAYGTGYIVFGKADGNVVDLAGGGTSFVSFDGPDSGGYLGNSISGAGDINGDGFADIIVGAYRANITPGTTTNNGRAYVIYGQDYYNVVTNDTVGGSATGTSSAETLIGSASADTLVGGGGADVIRAGGGGDTVAISDTTFKSLDGGLGGNDLLRLDGGMSLDLTTINNETIQGFEKINMSTDTKANTLTLNKTDVIALTDTAAKNVLSIFGKLNDKVILSAGFKDTGTDVTVDGITMRQYVDGNVTVQVERGIMFENSVNVHDGAVQMDGVNDYVDMGTLTGLTGAVTLEAWVRVDALSNRFFNLGSSTTTNANNILLVKQANGTVSFYTGNGAGTSVDAITTTTTIALNEWVHIAAVTDGNAGGAAIYFNGVKQDTGGKNTLIGATGADRTVSYIGTHVNAASSYFNGQMDEARIWNVARSEAEIRGSFDQQLNGDETGLHVYYRFDDNDGGTTVKDYSSNSFNGTLMNGASIINTLGKALSFDGVDDYVSVGTGNSIVNMGAAFTIETWIKTDNTVTSTIFSKSAASATVGSEWLYLSAGNLAFGYDATANNARVTNTTSDFVADGHWHHVAMTYNGSDTLTFYKDGAVLGTRTVTLSTDDATHAIEIGRVRGGALFKGQMDNLRFWNTSRSLAQITDNYNQTLTDSDPDAANLILNYTFDEMVANKIDDDAGTNTQATWVDPTGNPTAVPLSSSDTDMALKFNGTDGYIDLGSASELALGLSNFTIEAWIKTDVTNTTRMDIITIGHTGNAGEGIYLYTEDGDLKVNTNGATATTVSASINDQKWHHIAMYRGNWDGNNKGTEIYIDGVKVTSGVLSATPNLVLGASSIGGTDGSNFFSGYIDDVRIWNITNNSINSNKNVTLTGNQSGTLLANYLLDETISSTVTNTAGTFNGTLNGGVSQVETSPAAIAITAPIIYGNRMVIETDETASGYMVANDVLGTATFTIKTNPAHGTVSIDDTSGSWTYTPTAGYAGVDQFTITVVGASDATMVDAETVYLDIGSAPTSAEMSAGGGVGVFTEDAGAVVADPLMSLGGFSANVTSATVTIGNFQSGADVLAYVNTGSISGIFNATTGVLTLSGTATAALYEAALRSVTFDNTSQAPTTTTREITFAASSLSSTRAIRMVAVQDAPTITDVTKTATEDTTLTFIATDFTAKFTDVDGESLTKIKITSLPSNGVLKLSGTAITVNQEILAADLVNITYVPNVNFNGSDSFAWAGHDGTEYSGAANVSITVDAVNDLPTVSVFDTATNEDTTVILATSLFTGAYSDVESSALNKIQITVLPNTSHGKLQLNFVDIAANAVITKADLDLNRLKFVPTANYNGEATFQWKGHDGTGYSSVAATATITVNPVQDAPTVSDFAVSTNEDTTLALTLSSFTGTFTDVDGEYLSQIQITTLPNVLHGKLQLNGSDIVVNAVITKDQLTKGLLKFVPTANYVGDATFDWKGHDGTEYSSAGATSTITVNAVNDAPTLAAIAKSGTEDTTLIFTAANFTDQFTDIDGDTLTQVKITSLPTKGTLMLSGVTVTHGQVIVANNLANLTYVPNANVNGNTVDTFQWQGFDGTVYSAASNVNISLTAVNDAPSNASAYTTTNEDAAKILTTSYFTEKLVDVDGDALSQIQITVLPTKGTLKLDGNAVSVDDVITKAQLDASQLVYTPNAQISGSETFTFKVHDGTTYAASATTGTIYVYQVNDLPTISDFAKTINEGATYTFTISDFETGYSDEENAAMGSVKVTVLPSTTHGVLKLNGVAINANAEISRADINAGLLKYVATADNTSAATFNWQGKDDAAYSSAAATATINITAVNDAPTLADLTKAVNEEVTVTFTTADFTGKFTDVDGDTLTQIKVTVLPVRGILKLSGTAVTKDQVITLANLVNLTYVPQENNTTDMTFKWKGYDGTVYSAAEATVTMTFAAVNDAPLVSAVSVASALNTTYTYSLTDFSDSFTDVDNDLLSSIQITSLPDAANGKLQLNGIDVTANDTVTSTQLTNGDLKFVPATGIKGTTSFNWKGNDSADYSNESTASVLINGTAPQVDAGINNQTKAGSGYWNFSVPADAFKDLDGDTLSYAVLYVDSSGTNVGDGSLPSWVSFDANTGTFNGDPARSLDGQTLYFKVTANDATASANDTFSLTLTNVNNAPYVDNAMPDQKTTGAGVWTYQVPKYTFRDADGDTLTYSATLADGTPLPSWLSFDAGTRTFSGNPPGSLVDGSINIRVWASDGKSSAYDDFTTNFAAVNDPVELANAIPDQTFTGSGDWVYEVPANTFNDNDVETLNPTAKLVDSSGNLVGDGSMPSWLTFDTATQSFKGNPPPSTNGTSLYFKITATDPNSAANFDVFKLTITNANDAPTLDNPIGPQSLTGPGAWAYQVNANTFSDLDGDTLTYSATQADGTALPAWLSFDASTRTFSGNAPGGTPNVSLKVTVSDGNGGTNNTTFLLSVDQSTTNDIPVVNTGKNVPDQTFDGTGSWQYQVPGNTFGDGDGDAIALSATLGDGSALPSWLTFSTSTWTFSGNPPPSLDTTTIALKVTATDNQQGSVSDTFNLTIGNTTTVNDAPVLDKAQTPVFTTLNEDNTTSGGDTVASLVVDNSITDLDGAIEAIAVTAVDNTGGAWQYTTNGTTWLAFGTPTASAARLLDGANKIRFVPNADWNGTATITFRAWDKTAGSIGGTGDSTANGNGTAFSTVYDTASLTVNAVNDVPTIGVVNKTVNEDSSVTFTSADFTTQYRDVEGSAMTQIKVITGPSNGALSLSGSAVADGDIITLANLANLKYTPAGNYNGVDSFTWQGNDGTVYSANNNANISVSPINDAPVLDAAQSPALTAITEDATTTAGDTVAAIVVNSSITDVDGNAAEAIAVTAVDNTNGAWQFSRTNGNSWLAFGTPSTSTARLLSGSDNIRFVPTANWNGTATITFRAWDKTSGTLGGTANTTSNGTTTAFSTATDTVSIVVNAVNDAPTITAVAKTTNEDTSMSFAKADFTAKFSDIENSTMSQIKITVLPTNGILKLSGTAVTANQVITAADISNLTYLPNANVNGTDTITWAGYDGTAYSATNTVDITVNAVNDVPTITAVAKATNEDTSMSFAQADFTAKFSDVEGTAMDQIRVTVLSSNGTLKLNGTVVTANQVITLADIANLTYTPNANYNGTDSFSWQGRDGAGFSAASTVNITINAAEDLPEVSNFSASVVAGNTFTLTTAQFDGSFTDVDNDALAKIQVMTLPDAAMGKLQLNGVDVVLNDVVTRSQLNGGELRFVAKAGIIDAATFTWKGHDNKAYSAVAATATLNITRPQETTYVAPPPAPPPKPPPPGSGGGTGDGPNDPANAQEGLLTNINTGFGGGGGSNLGNGSAIDTIELGDSTGGSTGLVTAGAGSFKTAIIADTGNLGGSSRDGKSLVVFKGIADFHSATNNNSIFFTIPLDAFAHTETNAVVQLRATLGDGAELPVWLTFDTSSGLFEGQAPANFSGRIEILVVARDSNGLEAATPFSILIGAGNGVFQEAEPENAVNEEVISDTYIGDELDVAFTTYMEEKSRYFPGKPSLTAQIEAVSGARREAHWMAAFNATGRTQV